MAPLRKKRSKAWLYFTQIDDNIATCNNCKVSISSKGGTTSNMLKHLATQHAIHLQECRVFDTLLLTSDANESSSTIIVNLPKLLVVFLSLQTSEDETYLFCLGQLNS